MQNSPRPLLPSTQRETVLAFTLNLGLMANMTLIALLVTGEFPLLNAEPVQGGPVASVSTELFDDQETQAEEVVATVASDPSPSGEYQAEEMDDAPIFATPVAPVIEVNRVTPEPAVPEVAEKTEPVESEADSAPPVTFFKIPVE